MSVSNQNSTTKPSEKDLAQTPVWMIDSILSLLGNRTGFDLDVCANEATAKADLYYSLDEREEDALKLGWLDFNFCNPPFSNVMPFVEKAHMEALNGKTTVMILPNNPEVAYIRSVKKVADTIIEMPFRLKFQRPNGEEFLDKKGKAQSPKFSCLVALITPLGTQTTTRTMYWDFRVGFYKKGM